MKRQFFGIVAAAVMTLSGAAYANECAVEVQSALDATRARYVEGMTGLASANYSTRPGTYSDMACLDKFMKGDMDIFFRPPSLDDLLSQALSFACDKATEILTGATGGGSEEVLGILQGFAGGLRVPSASGGTTTVNMNDYVQNFGGAAKILTMGGKR